VILFLAQQQKQLALALLEMGTPDPEPLVYLADAPIFLLSCSLVAAGFRGLSAEPLAWKNRT
jgi:hypothetical protein